MRLVIMTGLSGSGKTTALRALEDLGFFCIDNLPFSLLAKFLDFTRGRAGEVSKAALVMDLRANDFEEEYQRQIETYKKSHGLEILFLEATEESLLRRFSETRRRHPLHQSSLIDSIRLEKEKLTSLRNLADFILDTTNWNPHQLRQIVQKNFTKSEGELQISLYSFGYRFGIPPDADIVFDVRFLMNPYFVEELRDLTGEDNRVMEYVLSQSEAQNFMDRFQGMLNYLLPLFRKEGKAYLTVAMGCTGGKHRSVALVNELSRRFRDASLNVQTHHRDMWR